jgi:SAM-dependent methyltransferase
MLEKVLVLGSGRSATQRVAVHPLQENVPFSVNFEKVVTLDIEPRNTPDFCASINLPWPYALQLGDFDEVHAYECLHLVGAPGNAADFFQVWRNIWRALKPGGLACCTTPWWESKWIFQDPASRTIYTQERLWYLDRSKSALEGMTNYSGMWWAPFNFITRYAAMRGEDPKNAGFTFVLQKQELSSGDQDKGRGHQDPGTPEDQREG